MLITIPGASNNPVTISTNQQDIQNYAAQIGRLLATIQGAGNLSVTTDSLPGAQSSVGVGTAGSISRLYQALLDRAPDNPGLQVWTNLVDNADISLADVAGGIVASPEYVQLYGSLSDTAFINQIYENLFARSADGAGTQVWLASLAGGASRGAVAALIADSAEAETNHDVTAGANNSSEVYRLYQAAFARAPESVGDSFWLSLLASGATVNQVAAAIAQSPEFVTDANMSVSDFVTAMYANALHRLPDDAGQATWIAALNAGESRSDVLVDFADSAESRALTAGAVSELVLASQGGLNLVVPGSYTYVVSNDAGADTLTASNAVIVANTVGGTFFVSGISTVAATGGNNTVNATGNYDLSFGAGNNLIIAYGSGTISTGTVGGANTVVASNLSGPANIIDSYGTGDVINASFGTTTVNAIGDSSTITGGIGELSVHVGDSNVDAGFGVHVVAGSNVTKVTVNGSGTSADIIGSGAPGATLTVVDLGQNDTVNAGAGAASIQATNNSAGLVVVGGTGSLQFVGGAFGATVFGGAGGSTVTSGTGLVFGAAGAADVVTGTAASTIFGSSDSNVTFDGAFGLTYGAASGNVTLDASAATGPVTASLGGGAGAASITLGTGDDSITAGAGSETLNAGDGNNQFFFAAGQTAGATDIVTDSLGQMGNDTVNFDGYTPTLFSTSGPLTITLSDNTTIIFTNLTDSSQTHINVTNPV